VYFDAKWSYWLADNIPGSRGVEFKDARILFPEERWREFNKGLRGPLADGRIVRTSKAPFPCQVNPSEVTKGHSSTLA